MKIYPSCVYLPCHYYMYIYIENGDISQLKYRNITRIKIYAIYFILEIVIYWVNIYCRYYIKIRNRSIQFIKYVYLIRVSFSVFVFVYLLHIYIYIYI